MRAVAFSSLNLLYLMLKSKGLTVVIHCMAKFIMILIKILFQSNVPNYMLYYVVKVMTSLYYKVLYNMALNKCFINNIPFDDK